MSARDFVEKDYYAALGVPKDAKAGDIKKSYRKLATELHPDRNPGGEERFKAVSEAYYVLSDTTKRREYDEARALYGSGGVPRGGRPGGFDVGDAFGGGAFTDVFSGIFGGRGRQGAPTRGDNVTTTARLDFLDALAVTDRDRRRHPVPIP